MFPAFYGKQTAKKEEEKNTVLSIYYYLLLCCMWICVRHAGCSHILRNKQATTHQPVTNPGGVSYGLLLLMCTLGMNLSLTAHTRNTAYCINTLLGA